MMDDWTEDDFIQQISPTERQVRTLSYLCSPDSEIMSDAARLGMFITIIQKLVPKWPQTKQ
jgi:hypothetical protein